MNLDFTNLGDISTNGGSKKDPNRIECKPENGTNGAYEFYGRFLPYPWDVTKSQYSKSIVSIKNPSVGNLVTINEK